ncbi:MAG: hypothetical protein GX996_08500 [Firmicutes bacterium]|nr:hypothetical protein [Bacillota bacterium]
MVDIEACTMVHLQLSAKNTINEGKSRSADAFFREPPGGVRRQALLTKALPEWAIESTV